CRAGPRRGPLARAWSAPGSRLLACRELEVRPGRERPRLAEAHDDAVVRLHPIVDRVLHLLAVHPGLEHQAVARLVGTELGGRELHAPDVEELAQLEGERL